MPDSQPAVEAFIERWSSAGGGERSNYQLFLTELCDLIGAPKPEPAVEAEQRNAYVFERRVKVRSVEGPDSTNFVDLYKRGCFVLEAKQSAKRREQIAELQVPTVLRPATSSMKWADWLEGAAETVNERTLEQWHRKAAETLGAADWLPWLKDQLRPLQAGGAVLAHTKSERAK